MVATKTLGPWSKGLNLANNRGSSIFLSNDELGSATNITYTVEGFIEPRPGYKRYLFNFGTFDTIEVIGSIELPDSSTVVFVQTVTGAAGARVAKVYKITDKTTCTQLTLTGLAADTVFTHVMSYQSTQTNHTGVFLFADQPNKSWRNPKLDLSGTWAVITPNYAVPASHTGIITKDRLFLFNYDTSTMIWSPPNFILDFNNYEANIQFGYGSDGWADEPIESTHPSDGIRSVQFSNNNFYIFKKTKAFMYTYQSSPWEDGYLRKISENLGGYDSVLFQNTVLVVNNRGVFRIDGTDFIDIQRQLNLRFEIPIDHANIKRQDMFITVYNDNVIVGFRDVLATSGSVLSWYYILSGKTGGWSEWKFDYASNIAAPGSKHFKAQNVTTTKSILLTNTFDKKFLNFAEYKPGRNIPEYHMDSDTTSNSSYGVYYIPPVEVKTAAFFGDSPVKYAKLYRTFIRFYMSDLPVSLLAPDTALWTLSVNYNSYKFSADTTNDGNPRFILHPSNAEFAALNMLEGSGIPGKTAVYQRTYQIPIPQQRIKEFVVELTRAYNTITPEALSGLLNPDADRPIKTAYYFMLAALWVDYQDKAGY